MQFRGLLAGAGLLAALSIGVWYSNKLEKEKEGKPAPDAPPRVVEIARDDIAQIEIARAGGETTVLKRNGSNWEITAPNTVRVDQEAANSLADTFKSLSSDRLVEEKATDWAGFGLATPKLVVTVTSKKGGKPVKLLIGDEVPAAGGNFARLDGDPRLFTLSSFNKGSVDKAQKDLQDKRVLPFDSDKLSRVEVGSGANTVEFGKNGKGEWQIVKPKPMRADGANVDDLVRRLKDVKIDLSQAEADVKHTAEQFAKSTTSATARLTDASGTHTIEVRKGKDDTYYGKGSGLEGYLQVTRDLGEALFKPITHYRQKKIFDFGWTDPNRIEVKDTGGVTRLLSKDGGKWKEGKAEMDAISVQTLVDKLRDLAATEIRDTGAATPFLEATVESGETKKTEKVSISKSGDKYFAVRENEPSVYELSKASVDEIQKVAKDVKPAVAAVKPDATKKK
jgi:Domain of unknown function (DUF4340)